MVIKKNLFKENISGFRYFFNGISLCFSKKYRKYIWAPIIIDIFIWAALWVIGSHYFTSFMSKFNNWLPTWLHWLDMILWVIYLGVFLIIGAYLFTFIANILLAPLLSTLAQSVQKNHLGEKPPSTKIKEIPSVIIKSFAREMRKIAYFIPWLIILIILFLIPGINIISSILWFLFGCWFQSMQYFDYCADQNQKSFKDLKIFMSKNKLASLSFGCGAMIVLMIPILNILVSPAAVIGATKLAIDLEITNKN